MEQKENLEENVASLQTEMNQKSEEVKMAQEENERLKELVVKDPEQWEETFLKIRNDINDAKKDTKELKESIPVKKLQEKKYQKVRDKLDDLMEKSEHFMESAEDFENIQERVRKLERAIYNKVSLCIENFIPSQLY